MSIELGNANLIYQFSSLLMVNTKTHRHKRIFGIHKDEVCTPFIILSDNMVYEERFVVSIQNR